jgi:hypothetical protein
VFEIVHGYGVGVEITSSSNTNIYDLMLPLLCGGNMDQWESSATKKAPIELQEEWRTRLEQARARYDQCTHEFQATEAEVNAGWLPISDGAVVMQTARIRESTAQNEYLRVLRVFSALVLYGRMPDESK